MTEEEHSEQSNKQSKYPPSRTAGLKPYKPGQSGNPGGRPPDTLTPLLREYLNANDEAEKKKIVNTLLSLAKLTGVPGQASALKEIFDRIDGKVPDTHKIESDVPISIIYKQVGDRDDTKEGKDGQ